MARGTCSRSGPGMEGTLGKGKFVVVKLGRHRLTETQDAGGDKIIDKSQLDAVNLDLRKLTEKHK